MKKVIFLILLLGLSFSVFGKKVTGTVTDIEGNPLIGVAVIIKGTLTGVLTDVDGQYQIYCDPDDVLVFNILSFKTEEEPVGDRTVINVVMKDEYWPPFEGRSLEAAGFRFWKGER